MKLSDKGFTFVELLIAISIFSVLAGSIYFNFHTGVFLYSRTADDLDRLNDFRLSFSKVEKELRNAVSFEEIPVFGNKTTLRFPSMIDTYTDKSVQRQFAEVEYSFKSKILYRKIRAISAESLREEKARKQAFLTDVYDWQFEYGFLSPNNEIVWKNNWEESSGKNTSSSSGSSIPHAIRFSFKYKKNNQKVSSDEIFTHIQKTIFLPQGQWREALLSA